MTILMFAMIISKRKTPAAIATDCRGRAFAVNYILSASPQATGSIIISRPRTEAIITSLLSRLLTMFLRLLINETPKSVLKDTLQKKPQFVKENFKQKHLTFELLEPLYWRRKVMLHENQNTFQ